MNEPAVQQGLNSPRLRLMSHPFAAVAPRFLYTAWFTTIDFAAAHKSAIDAFQRDTDNWRATIRRLDGKKIRVAAPPSVLDQATTSADALTAEKAVELARKAIDGGGLT